jgi:hypothetical protein
MEKLISTVVFAILIASVLVSVVFMSGCTNPIDPCEQQLQDCNHACGDGILSGICKEKCTYDYNQCKSK